MKDSQRHHGKWLYFRRRNILVDFLSVIYGIGSWIAMTGLWVELPLLVQRLPDRWKLASRLTLTLQLANVGPIVYGIFNHYYPSIVNERSGTHGQLAIGSLSTLLLVFFWSSTVRSGSTEFSLALYVLSFGLSIVDCTSSVVFLPYMAFFKSVYLVPYLIGEGLSGLLPSLVAMGQGIDNVKCVNQSYTNISNNVTVTLYKITPTIEEPRFEPEVFFIILLAMVAMSWLAFFLLDNLAICRKEMVCTSDKENKQYCTKELKNLRYSDQLSKGAFELQSRDIQQSIPLNSSCCNENHELHNDSDKVAFKTNSGNLKKNTVESKTKYYYLLCLQGWASIATFGVFPAIQTYSCLPYGDTAFHYAVTLCGLAYPVACLIAMFIEVRSLSIVSLLSLFGTVVSVFIMYTAVTAPKPPLVGTTIGTYIVVICWVAFIGVLSYVKTVVTVLLGDYWGHKGLFWCGAVTQAGAAFGAFLMYLLVNVFELFYDQDQCIE